MDAFTLVVVSLFAATIMAGSMGLLYRYGSRQPCLRDWAWSGALFACNNILGVLAIKFQVAHFLVPAAANTLYIAGHFGILAGLRRHLGLPSGWKLLLAGIAVVPLLHVLPVMRESVVHRLFLLTPVIAAINLGVALTVWRRVERRRRAAYLPLLVLELVFMTQLSARTLYLYASEGYTLTFLGSQFLQTSGTLFVLCFLFVVTMSCALIVIHQQGQALRLASLTDALTGCLNRRAMQDVATREFGRCRDGKDGKEGLFFVTFDVDRFKSINDRHGHAVGDAALRHVAAVAAGALPEGSVLFRMGGEEFAFLVIGGQLDGACHIAERLRERLGASPMEAGGVSVPVTVSVGVAALDAGDEHWDQVLGRADAALYHAKEHGRNRVSVYGRELSSSARAMRETGTG